MKIGETYDDLETWEVHWMSPKVAGKKYPYTKSGRKAAAKAKARKPKKK